MNDFRVRLCPVCGGRFIPAAFHVYKRIRAGKTYRFCGWNCMRRFEKALLPREERA